MEFETNITFSDSTFKNEEWIDEVLFTLPKFENISKSSKIVGSQSKNGGSINSCPYHKIIHEFQNLNNQKTFCISKLYYKKNQIHLDSIHLSKISYSFDCISFIGDFTFHFYLKQDEFIYLSEPIFVKKAYSWKSIEFLNLKSLDFKNEKGNHPNFEKGELENGIIIISSSTEKKEQFICGISNFKFEIILDMNLIERCNDLKKNHDKIRDEFQDKESLYKETTFTMEKISKQLSKKNDQIKNLEDKIIQLQDEMKQIQESNTMIIEKEKYDLNFDLSDIAKEIKLEKKVDDQEWEFLRKSDANVQMKK